MATLIGLSKYLRRRVLPLVILLKPGFCAVFGLHQAIYSTGEDNNSWQYTWHGLGKIFIQNESQDKDICVCLCQWKQQRIFE
jgi:hypothetical protein